MPSPRVGCKEVQYQCDYLHACNILIIRVISVLTSSLEDSADDGLVIGENADDAGSRFDFGV